MPSQNAFPSLVSPHDQLNNINILRNVPSISSLLQKLLSNGSLNFGISVLGKQPFIKNSAEFDLLSRVANGKGSNPPPYMSVSVTTKSNSSGQVQEQQQFPNPSGYQMLAD